MKEEFVPVYMASTVAVAQKLADRLTRNGIESFVDDTLSPMYGMSLGPQSRVINVRSPAEPRAREIIESFQAEYNPPMPQDWQGEQTGLEIVKPQRPSDDSPNEPYAPGTEALSEDTDPAGPESAYLRDDRGAAQAGHRDRIQSIGADRPPIEMPDAEDPELTEQPLDKLDVNERLAAESLRHPTADSPPRND